MSRDNKLCGSAPSAVGQCDALALGLMQGWLLALAWPRVLDVAIATWSRVGKLPLGDGHLALRQVAATAQCSPTADGAGGQQLGDGRGAVAAPVNAHNGGRLALHVGADGAAVELHVGGFEQVAGVAHG